MIISNFLSMTVTNRKTFSVLLAIFSLLLPNVGKFRHKSNPSPIFIARQHMRDIDIANLSVRLSVRPSVTFRYWINGLTYRHSFFSLYGSPIILVLSASNIFTNSYGFTLCGGTTYRWGIRFRDFLPISCYISQTIQDSAIVTMEGD